MTNDKQWNGQMAEHELAYLRGDLVTSSPESYTIDEMKFISDGIFASTAEVDAAMRKDFQELPAHAQAKMLDLLQKADPEHFGWWFETLASKTPDMPPQTT